MGEIHLFFCLLSIGIIIPKSIAFLTGYGTWGWRSPPSPLCWYSKPSLYIEIMDVKCTLYTEVYKLNRVILICWNIILHKLRGGKVFTVACIIGVKSFILYLGTQGPCITRVSRIQSEKKFLNPGVLHTYIPFTWFSVVCGRREDCCRALTIAVGVE